MHMPMLVTRLDAVAVAAVDRTAQAADMLDLGVHVRDALARVERAGLGALDASHGLVICGMGGSAIGGRLALGALGTAARRPVTVVDGYELPAWVDERTAVLCSSYSGLTEETLACYEAARARGAAVVVATTGGALAQHARRDGVPVIALAAGLQPRAAVGYALVCALQVAALAGASAPVADELRAASRLVDGLAVEWGPDGAESGEAKRLARRLDGTVPVIMGAGLTAPVAYRWKCQCNENAKLPAFASVLPEADHNEICGWDAAGQLGEFSAVLLEDPTERAELTRRYDLTAELCATGARTVARVVAPGSGRVARLLSLVLLGDLVSLYLAVLRGVDPVEIQAIKRLKAGL